MSDIKGIETLDGRQLTFKELSDEHLANWIYHSTVDAPSGYYDEELIGKLRAEAKSRGLSERFLKRADGSFMRDGVRLRYDKYVGRYMQVPYRFSDRLEQFKVVLQIMFAILMVGMLAAGAHFWIQDHGSLPLFIPFW